MFKNILTPDQLDLLPLIREFTKDYYLVGGTAIALQAGHRRSIDFDLFTQNRIKKNTLKRTIKMPDILSLAAMKAYALGGRAKWKDYVDLHLLLKNHFTLARISEKAREIFGVYYNEKLFREQLCYFENIDYSETVDFVGPPPSEEEIRQFLTEIATTSLS